MAHAGLCRVVRLGLVAGVLMQGHAWSQSPVPVEATGSAATPPSLAAGPGEEHDRGDVWRDPVTGMEFVWVPGGTFEMGCGAWNRDCASDEKPAREVTLSGFWLGRTEVTQGQWKKLMDYNWSSFNKGDDYPVESVTWDEAQEYIRKLNVRSDGVTFRLPTEAEWEYACRAGGKERVYGTRTGEWSGALANSGHWFRHTTTRVASYPPNALGLYDMSGNVAEWVQDAYDRGAYARMAAVDPLNNTGAYRISRGGGWNSDAQLARCSYRRSLTPSARGNNLGFRLARNP